MPDAREEQTRCGKRNDRSQNYPVHSPHGGNGELDCGMDGPSECDGNARYALPAGRSFRDHQNDGLPITIRDGPAHTQAPSQGIASARTLPLDTGRALPANRLFFRPPFHDQKQVGVS